MIGSTKINLMRGAAIVAIASALFCAPIGNQAQATTATTSLSVTATVLSVCIVAATPLAFGNYDPTSSTALAGTTTLAVTCTNGTTYNVGLGPGAGTGATVASHKMTFGANLLNYTLYSNATHTTVWGQTVGTDTQSGVATGLPISYTIYGLIPAQQTVPSGAYSDSVTVTVTY
jgi:spore coat protein U-like protein